MLSCLLLLCQLLLQLCHPLLLARGLALQLSFQHLRGRDRVRTPSSPQQSRPRGRMSPSTYLNSLLLAPRGLLVLHQLLIQLLHLAGHRSVTRGQQAGMGPPPPLLPRPSPRTPVADAAVSSANCPQWDQAAGGGSAPNGFAVPKFSALPRDHLPRDKGASCRAPQAWDRDGGFVPATWGRGWG